MKASIIAWLCVGAVAMLAIYGTRPKRKNRLTYKPRPDERDTLRYWRNSWRS